MSFHRHTPLPATAAVLLAVAGCAADAPVVAVPTPPQQESALCRALHKALPDSVAGMERQDPEPRSELTAGWGDAAIVLRCGVPRPPGMSDPQGQAAEVNGVDWLVEERDGDGPRLTTASRKTYVEVTLGEKYAHDLGPLTDLAAPVAKTIPALFTEEPAERGEHGEPAGHGDH
ncbi:DUF3515 domain-containing protein [Streptomyces sp. NPDC127084]|uniref:DUF3515 domain-containing protein n=1 Tax=Streptomyces sp. NPDC127084 TaxID=3347133 RepID=UPI00364E4751